MAQILVVDDHPEMRAVVREALELDGHQVTESDTAAKAVDHVANRPVDLVLLDIGLPDRSGLDVLADLHERASLPVIFVSGRGQEMDRVVGLRMGADDYITKPFSIHELTARVAAALRRSTRADAPSTTELTFGSLVILPLERRVLLDGQPIAMTAKELDLLVHFARHPMRVFGREELLRDVWHSRIDWQDPATVTEHVRRLRRKIEVDPLRPRRLETVRGVGYRLVS